jgi:hypothetical protein
MLTLIPRPQDYTRRVDSDCLLYVSFLSFPPLGNTDGAKESEFKSDTVASHSLEEWGPDLTFP